MIKIINVTKTFGNITALNKLSIHIRKGELFGLVGPNGAGKTTAIRIVCGILHPTKGRVLIDDRDVFENIDIKKRIGYLPEEPNLYTRPTAFELLQYFGSLYGNSSPQRVEDLLTFVGLHHRKDSKVETFSKGMRQRLAFARALVHDPEILILDEPTMGLDPATAKKVRQFIKTFKRKKTIILCTHYMEEADELCDRVGFLDRGKIVKVGEPLQLKEELKQESTYEVIVNNSNPVLLQQLTPHVISQDSNRLICSLTPEDISGLLSEYQEEIFSIRTITPTLADVFERYTHGIQ
ncbi:MAG: ABC transporter ATP-binding protein [Theionarchaea archaeon]|nr:ABC transporter ATP-binding protein [Theionarchaea archaeon]